MTALRAALVAVGLTVGGYGVFLIFEFRLHTIVLIAVWAAVGVIVHDFVFAPLSAALGWTGRRVISGSWWMPVTVAALCSAVLVLLAIPVYNTPGARPDNATVVDRNYALGLWISLAVVWVCVPIYYIVAAVTARLAKRPGP